MRCGHTLSMQLELYNQLGWVDKFMIIEIPSVIMPRWGGPLPAQLGRRNNTHQHGGTSGRACYNLLILMIERKNTTKLKLTNNRHQ